MSGSVRLPKEIGDKLFEKIGLAPGGLKKIQVNLDVESGEVSLEDIARALVEEKADFEVLKHFEFASLEGLADDLLRSYSPGTCGGATHPPLHVVLIQAAALECFLNDVFIHYARTEYGEDSIHLGPYLISGSFRSKLHRVVPTLSKGTKILDKNSKVVKYLEELITTRNRISHTTEYYTDLPKGQKRRRRSLKPFAQTVTTKRCEQFQKALREFTSAVWNGPPWSGDFFKDPTPEEDNA